MSPYALPLPTHEQWLRRLSVAAMVAVAVVLVALGIVLYAPEVKADPTVVIDGSVVPISAPVPAPVSTTYEGRTP